ATEDGLLSMDGLFVIFTVDSGNVIKRIVLCDREAEKALIKNIRGAHRRAVAARRRIGLVTIEIPGLRGVGKLSRIGRDQIRVTGDAIVLRRAAEGIGMDGKVAAACVQQCGTVKAAVNGSACATKLRTDPAARNVGRDAVVG